MKTLLVMRHAKSSWNDMRLADHDRPLNRRGKADAPRMGQLLKREEMTPDLIISSSAARARRTAELVAESSDYDEEIELTRSFYHADPEEYLARLVSLDNALKRVMIVGHNPGMEELVEALTDTGERLTTANIAVIDLALNRWDSLTLDSAGTLREIWRPRELG